MELLAGPQADVLDRDRIRVAPGQPREVARQVDDPHRLAHVQDEQVARLAEQRGLEDQPRRLRDRHEEAGHLGVRDGQRHALAELALEERDDAPRGAEDVPEADRDVAATRRRATAADGQLGQPFRGAHDGGRRDGLVRGDQDEPFDAGAERRAQRGQRPADVRVDRVGRVVLHHRHVLVGGGVEDHDRPVLGEDPFHPVERGDVRQPRDELGAGTTVAGRRPRIAPAEEGEFAFDVVERAFGAIEQDEPGGVEVVELARQLGADRPAGAGHEDRPPGHEIAQTPLVHDDRVAAQEVGHLDLADRGGAEPARDQFLDGGDRARLEPKPRRVLDGAADHVARTPPGSR